MLPVIRLGGFIFQTWGIFVFLAVAAVWAVGRVCAPKAGFPAGAVDRAWPWLIAGGFLGAHFYWLLAVEGWPLRPVPLSGLANPFGGTAGQGGILGGLAAAALFVRFERIPLLRFLDAMSPGGALAQGIARLGCFAAGCCFGRRTDLFFGVTYTSPFADPSVPRGVPLHPAQLYEAALDAALAWLLYRRLRAGRQGRVFILYIGGYALIRFAVQFFRDDDAGRLLFGLAHSQYLSLAMLAALLIAWPALARIGTAGREAR